MNRYAYIRQGEESKREKVDTMMKYKENKTPHKDLAQVCVIQDQGGGIRRATERKMRREGYEIYGYDPGNPDQSIAYDPVYLYGSVRAQMGYGEYMDAVKAFVMETAAYLPEGDRKDMALLMNAYMVYLGEFGPISKNPGSDYGAEDLLDILKDLPVSIIRAHVPEDSVTFLCCEEASTLSQERMAHAENHLRDLMWLFLDNMGQGPLLASDLFDRPCVLYVSVPPCKDRENPVFSALVQQLKTVFGKVLPDARVQFWMANEPA
jgi:hypothetical protein